MKQAMLIMYHNDFYILEKLLKLIDHENIDIYLHVDKKVKDFPFDKVKKMINKSNIYFTPRMDVRWATFLQIKCELLLLKEASKRNYKYYHLISGCDLPLKKIDEIYNYFNKENKEFLAFEDFDKIKDSYVDRIRYYHVFNQNRRSNNRVIKKIYNTLYYRLLNLQKKLRINRLKKNKLELRKGANWFSITDSLVKCVLDNEKLINKKFKYSDCADELFLQTIAYNFGFKDKCPHYFSNEHFDIKRYIDWERGEPYTFRIDDFDELMNSDMFFARKFSSSIDKEIIDKIYESLSRRKYD